MDKISKIFTNTKTIFGVAAGTIFCCFLLVKSLIDNGSVKGNIVNYVLAGVVVIVVLVYTIIYLTAKSKSTIKNKGNRNRINQGRNSDGSIDSSGDDNDIVQGR